MGQAGNQAPVIPQYFVVSLGIFVEPFLRSYSLNRSWNHSEISVFGQVIFGLIVGIIILPSIYKASFDPDKPILVQLAALFPLGIGWQSLFTSATKLVG